MENTNKTEVLNDEMAAIFEMVNTEDKIKQTFKEDKEPIIEIKESKKMGRPSFTEEEKADIKISTYITKSLNAKIEAKFKLIKKTNKRTSMSSFLSDILESYFEEK
ncbi:hypothetical protein [Aliarcobacter butzleri]|uniref:hypothetical protein n=1 Tax=Aliarcobacter butzleri TaxID=28197 RepID=UPI0021B2047F|nr:hypothetical protein [Aliarcobacter butzleri]MCT7632119.1 hypothetical protein [Aliarcobacter butzleri]